MSAVGLIQELISVPPDIQADKALEILLDLRRRAMSLEPHQLSFPPMSETASTSSDIFDTSATTPIAQDDGISVHLALFFSVRGSDNAYMM